MIKALKVKHVMTKAQYQEVIDKVVNDYPQLKSVSFNCFVSVINAVCKPTIILNVKSTEYLANKLNTFLTKHDY